MGASSMFGGAGGRWYLAGRVQQTHAATTTASSSNYNASTSSPADAGRVT
jgi:hypothetical protein